MKQRIPIHAAGSGDLVFPIDLLYNGSGVKVSEIPGWVGLNWVLEAEGYYPCGKRELLIILSLPQGCPGRTHITIGIPGLRMLGDVLSDTLDSFTDVANAHTLVGFVVATPLNL